ELPDLVDQRCPSLPVTVQVMCPQHHMRVDYPGANGDRSFPVGSDAAVSVYAAVPVLRSADQTLQFVLQQPVNHLSMLVHEREPLQGQSDVRQSFSGVSDDVARLLSYVPSVARPAILSPAPASAGLLTADATTLPPGV